jgi:uncharacterized membrane protein
MNTAKIIRQEFDSRAFTTLQTVNVPQEIVDGFTIDQSVYIYRPVSEVYRFWRKLGNLQDLIGDFESIEVKNLRHSRWTMKLPFGSSVEWKAEITEEQPNELIRWISLKGSDVANTGTIHFEPMLDGKGTEVRIQLKYRPPMGRFGLWVANLFGFSPEKKIEEALFNMKDLLEEQGRADTKEIPVYAA